MTQLSDLIDHNLNPYYNDSKANYLLNVADRGKLCPVESDVFRIFDALCSEEIKVVILGQDPYPNPEQADGFAFSSASTLPQSLRNIFRNIEHFHGTPKHYFENKFYHYSLNNWVNQGVCLLNTCLTTEKGEPGVHKHLGWQPLVADVIQKLSRDYQPIVWMLWGRNAQKFKKHIKTPDRHLIIESSHPSPLSVKRSFSTTNHFGMANEWLEQQGYEPIDWFNINNYRIIQSQNAPTLDIPTTINTHNRLLFGQSWT